MQECVSYQSITYGFSNQAGSWEKQSPQPQSFLTNKNQEMQQG